MAYTTTISGVILPSSSNNWSRDNLFQPNPSKCKELDICFKRSPPDFTQTLNRMSFDRISSDKVLGVTIRMILNGMTTLMRSLPKPLKDSTFSGYLRGHVSLQKVSFFFTAVLFALLWNRLTGLPQESPEAPF